MKLRRIVIAVLSAALSACVLVPQYEEVVIVARRPPPPGSATFEATVRYIDDGLRYVDPRNAFFIGSGGRMCFRGAYTLSQTIWDDLFKTDWCLFPTAVKEVALVPDIVTGSYQLQLACKHSAGQCVTEGGSLYRQANFVTLPIVPPRQEKVAIEHLVYLMGGSLGDPSPF